MVKPEVRDKLPEVFDTAASGIKDALAFLKELGVTSDRLLPYGLQLVLLGEFFRLCPQPAAKVVELLNRWFWATSFTGWFGGINTTQATRALGEIPNLPRARGPGSTTLISTPRLSRFPTASMDEAPAYVPFCSTLRRFVLVRSEVWKISILVDCLLLAELGR